jgi:hypothetical protein
VTVITIVDTAPKRGTLWGLIYSIILSCSLFFITYLCLTVGEIPLTGSALPKEGLVEILVDGNTWSSVTYYWTTQRHYRGLPTAWVLRVSILQYMLIFMLSIFNIKFKKKNGLWGIVSGTHIPGFIKIPIAVVEIFATADARMNVRTYERTNERTHNDHFNMLSVLPDNIIIKADIIQHAPFQKCQGFENLIV